MMSNHKKAKIGLVLVFLVVLGSGYSWVASRNNQQDSTKSSSKTKQDDIAGPHYSLTDPASLWMIVSKRNPLPSTYRPASLRAPSIKLRGNASNLEMQLRNESAEAVERLVSAAKEDGMDLMFVSGYRSYDLQKSVYDGNVARDGQANADKYSARPGHSEHQTGLAVDFGVGSRQCELEECFGDTSEGKWLVAHAADYGFVLRYPKNKEGIVGYNYEPWHFRYVGEGLAKSVNKSGLTLEELFGLPPAPTYN